MTNLIQPGDVFVKQYGKREIVHIFLPPRGRSGKTYYLHLGSGNEDCTWVTDRDRLTTARALGGQGFTLVGTVPPWFLKELMTKTNGYVK